MEVIHCPNPSASSRGHIHPLPALPISARRVVRSHRQGPDTCRFIPHKVTFIHVASYPSADRAFRVERLCQRRSGEDLRLLELTARLPVYKSTTYTTSRKALTL